MGTLRRKLIAGNWKMYKTTTEAAAFVDVLAEHLRSLPSHDAALPEIVLCPPYTTLQTSGEAITRANAPFVVAAQNMESRDQGAYTGEIAPPMLLDLGVRWVVLGHSERRQYFNETDDAVAQKMAAAFAHGMTPIVCVGESLAEREAGQTDHVIERQLAPLLAVLTSPGTDSTAAARLVIAYEPVWAIGTGRVCEADEAGRVCGLIRHHLRESAPAGLADATRILYGGSVKPENTQALMAQPDIDGALVGGASLDADSFYRIIEKTTSVRLISPV
jgi:triosephosphate isomerase